MILLSNLDNVTSSGAAVEQVSDHSLLLYKLLIVAFLISSVYAVARSVWLNRRISHLLKTPGAPPSKYLRVVSEWPYSAESPMWALQTTYTPIPLFYVRNHFDVPHIDADKWTLRVLGLGGKEKTFRLRELKELDQRCVTVVLECAGNGRKAFRPAIKGEIPWDYGAVSTTVFTGTPLGHVLQQVGVQADEQNGIKEVLFEGMDRGKVKREVSKPYDPENPSSIEPFARSLPLVKAMHDDTLLAWAMDGSPLTPEHGYPLRLVVPGWYAMASVKWLGLIKAMDRAFDGHFQVDRYVFKNNEDTVPVREIGVCSIIAWPNHEARLSAGRIRLRGAAWSGEKSIRRVEVSTDGGHSWADAELTQPPEDILGDAPTLWSFAWTAKNTRPREHVIMSRATDSDGETQLPEKDRNLYGYGNNSIRRMLVTVG